MLSPGIGQIKLLYVFNGASPFMCGSIRLW